MRMTILRKSSPVSVAVLSVLIGLMPAAASAATYLQDTNLVVGGQTLKVMAGSEYQSLVVASNSFMVTLAEGQAFIVRSPGIFPMSLDNDALQPGCRVLTTRDNQLILNGPRTVTVTPGTAPCDTSNYSTDTTPFLAISQPNGGETLKEGQAYQIFWSTSGGTVGNVRLSYSTDGGATWPTIVDNKSNDGFYSWTVPSVTTTDNARLRVQGVNQGLVTAIDISNSDFRFEGTKTAVPPPSMIITPVVGYDPADATQDAATIGIDKNLPHALFNTCIADTRIKVIGQDAVYYCGRDGKRYVFPNRKTHDTWYEGFNGVVELDLATMQKIPLGGNVTYRPGVRMVKIQTANEVFAVDANGLLHHIATEAAAKRLYGSDWNKKIDDLPDAFFVNYAIGDPILE
ncbi:hypothetical protein HY633_00365 [Candidatus Uhrbacteria bacterium]|nr:hypothetical protein [Candidatus Uhrbacteria bacterium]